MSTVNISSFGAAPSAPRAVNTAAIVNAIAAAGPGGVVLIPSGRFNVNTIVPPFSVRFQGESLMPGTAADGAMLCGDGGAGALFDLSSYGMTQGFQWHSLTLADKETLVDFGPGGHVWTVFDRVTFWGASKAAIRSIGFLERLSIRNGCFFNQCRDGILVEYSLAQNAGGIGTFVDNAWIEHTQFNCFRSGIRMDNSRVSGGVRVRHVLFKQCGEVPVWWYGPALNCDFDDVGFEYCGTSPGNWPDMWIRTADDGSRGNQSNFLLRNVHFSPYDTGPKNTINLDTNSPLTIESCIFPKPVRCQHGGTQWRWQTPMPALVQ